MAHHRIIGLKAIFLLLNLCFLQASFGEDIQLGKTIYSQCVACHSLETNLQQIGPSLSGVVNRKIGSVADYRYSNSLRNSTGVWSPERLNAFLENPQAALPGNRMPYSGLTNPTERAALIAYLATIKP